MTRPRALPVVAAALVLAAALAGCTGTGGDAPSSSTSAPSSGTPAASATPTPAAAPPPAPRERACYRLAYDAAVAPTSTAHPVPCSSRHTSVTYAVHPLDALVDGHLLAVDSTHVREQVAASCPDRFAGFVGGSEDDRRLSMLRPVWFTPTVEESDAGASWYRCDVVAVAGKDRLAPLSGRMAGVLGSSEGRDRYGMCGTAEPGTRSFERVMCGVEHSWKAVSVVDLPDGRYPGEQKVRSAGDDPCSSAGSDAAGGALDYQWGYEWPTRQQWVAGQHYGICWVPS